MRTRTEKRLMVIEASSGDTIPNLFRIRVDNEVCDIVVGPVRKAGTYYCYYLPYEVQPGWGYYNRGYLPPEAPASGHLGEEERPWIGCRSLKAAGGEDCGNTVAFSV